jgi:hypothetical protein
VGPINLIDYDFPWSGTLFHVVYFRLRDGDTVTGREFVDCMAYVLFWYHIFWHFLTAY